MNINDKITQSIAETVKSVMGIQEASASDIKKILAAAKKAGADIKGNQMDFGQGAVTEVSIEKGKIKFDGGMSTGVEYFNNAKDAIMAIETGIEETEVQDVDKDFVDLHNVDDKEDPEQKKYSEEKEEEDEEDVEEGNAFGQAVTDAKKAGKKKFTFQGKEYKVESTDLEEANNRLKAHTPAAAQRLIKKLKNKFSGYNWDDMVKGDEIIYPNEKYIIRFIKKQPEVADMKESTELEEAKSVKVKTRTGSDKYDYDELLPEVQKIVIMSNAVQKNKRMDVAKKITKSIIDGKIKNADISSDLATLIGIDQPYAGAAPKGVVKDRMKELKVESTDLEEAKEIKLAGKPFTKLTSKGNKTIISVAGGENVTVNLPVDKVVSIGKAVGIWDGKKVNKAIEGPDAWDNFENKVNSVGGEILPESTDLEEALSPKDFVNGGDEKITQREVDSMLSKLFGNDKMLKSLEANKAYKDGYAGKTKNPYKKDTADYHLFILGQQSADADAE